VCFWSRRSARWCCSGWPAQLADDLPQVAELELSPVLARPDGAVAVDARVRIQAADPADAYLRQLP